MKTFISIISLVIGVATYGATATTPIFGTYKIDCPSDSDTYIGIPVTRMPEFSGTVQSVILKELKLVANGEPKWDANKFVISETQANRYYLKFTSGALEGAWFDIKSNDTYSLVIAIGEAELGKVIAGDSFQIIPHWTLATLFPEGGGFSKATGFLPTKGATLLYKYSKFGEEGVEYRAGTDQDSLGTFNYRKKGTKDCWINASQEDASDVVFEPNCAFIAVQSSGAISATISGVIPMCASSFELFTISNGEEVPSQDIFLTVPAGVDIKLSELTASLITSGAFTPTKSLLKRGDTMYVYSNVNTGIGKSSDKTCVYRERTTGAQWEDASQNSADSLVLKAGSVLLIRKKSSGTEFATRCKFSPTYLNQK